MAASQPAQSPEEQRSEEQSPEGQGRGAQGPESQGPEEPYEAEEPAGPWVPDEAPSPREAPSPEEPYEAEEPAGSWVPDEPPSPREALPPEEAPPPEEALSPLAEPGQRLLARIVDTLIVGLPVIVVVRELVTGRDVDVVAPPAVAGCLLLYEAIQLAVWGRTLGKRFAGIEVAAAEPQGSRVPPGVLRAVLRAAVYALPVAVRPVPVLGLLAGLFWVANAGFLYEGTSRQALHDRLVGTVVLKRPSPESSPL